MSIAFTIINSATNNSTIYIGESTSLDLTLTNNTGDEIRINSETNASEIQIEMPEFFTAEDMNKMTVDLNGWSLEVDTSWKILTLTYIASTSKTWSVGTDITITINDVCATSDNPSDGEPTIVDFENFTENPSSVSSHLKLASAPVVVSSLADVLQVFLKDQGKISVNNFNYGMIKNTLFLTIKNIGTSPLYNDELGPPPAAYNPMVEVSFVYGSGSDDSSGVLTTNIEKRVSAIDSAWNIDCSIDDDQGNDWEVKPLNQKEDYPIWQLAPANSNIPAIKTGGNSNVTFSFSNIISDTLMGNTQMTVSFSGFMQDANTPYDDTVFTLNIAKLYLADNNKGILDFCSDTPIIDISGPNDEILIDLKWTLRFVNSVILRTSLPDSMEKEIQYTDEQSEVKDTTSISLSGISTNTPLTIDLYALDVNGNYLNGKQFTVFINIKPFDS